jgi:hypothetical protein
MHLPRRLAPYLSALAVQLVFAGYVKDDAYIEYRFATNLAGGHGLCFNPGDPPVEGFTSFLWTAFLALPARLGLDLVVFAKIAGTLALLAVIALSARLVRGRGGTLEAQRCAEWVAATSGSLLVWAQSGMEPVIAAAAVLGAAVALAERRVWLALLLAALSAGLRPECHLVLLFTLALVAAQARRDARARPAALVGAALALVVVGGMHWIRYRYYGSLIPNTALVKAATVSLAAGLRALGELAVTGLAGLLIALALAEAWRRRDDVALLGAAALTAFAAYLVRVGRDEMFLCRLYLPVLPLAIALAAPSLARLPRWTTTVVCLVGLGFAAGHLGVIRYLALGRTSYVPLAEAMLACAKPGDLAIFQDLGRTPYEAMQLRFYDPIGLVDRAVARVRYRDHASPFVRLPTGKGMAEIRDHLLALDPRLVAFVAYVGAAEQPEVKRRFDAAAGGDRERLLAPFVDANPYHVGLHDDARFRARFRFVDAWRRHDGYYLVLYEALK